MFFFAILTIYFVDCFLSLDPSDVTPAVLPPLPPAPASTSYTEIFQSKKQYDEVFAAARDLAEGTTTAVSIRSEGQVFLLEPLIVYQATDESVFKMTRSHIDTKGNRYMKFVLPSYEDAFIVATVNLILFLAHQAVVPIPYSNVRAHLSKYITDMLEFPFANFLPWKRMYAGALKVKDVLADPSTKHMKRKLNTIMKGESLCVAQLLILFDSCF